MWRFAKECGGTRARRVIGVHDEPPKEILLGILVARLRLLLPQFEYFSGRGE